MTFRSAKLYRREGFEAIGQLRPVVIIGSFEPVVAADWRPTGNWKLASDTTTCTRTRAYFSSKRVCHCSLLSLTLSLSISASLSPSERQQFHDDDDDIARQPAATSIRMNTEESITAPMDGADRRERALHDLDLHR